MSILTTFSKKKKNQQPFQVAGEAQFEDTKTKPVVANGPMMMEHRGLECGRPILQ